MSILDLHADEQVQASLNTAPAPVAPPAKFSAWSAIPRAIGVAAGEVGASAADLVNAARVLRDTLSREIAASGLPTSAFSSELGDTVRSYWNDFKPDPNTATTAEQMLFGFSRGLAKVVPATIAAGPVGAVVAGIEEGMTVSDELRRKGVGADARTKAGLIQGAGLASAALPLLGTTLAETAALYVAGGPGGADEDRMFVALAQRGDRHFGIVDADDIRRPLATGQHHEGRAAQQRLAPRQGTHAVLGRPVQIRHVTLPAGAPLP